MTEMLSGAFESLTGFALLDPSALGWLVLVLAALVARRVRGHRVASFGPAVLLSPRPPALLEGRTLATRQTARVVVLDRLRPSLRVRLRCVPTVLVAVGLVGCVVASARPVQVIPLPPSSEGIDILLALDVSSSMAAEDLEAGRTRLAVTQDAAARFIEGRRDDRIGLVAFARYPDLRCPPTRDHDSLIEMLRAIETVDPDGPEDATGIGTAVARAGQVLTAVESRSKVVVLLTDGEENVASSDSTQEIAPVHAAQLCERLGIRVYTIAAGVGRPDRTGRRIPLDTTQVERLAARTGGKFFRARDAGALSAVWEEIARLETTILDDPKTRTEDRFLPFLLVGLGAIFLGSGLRRFGFEVLP